MLNKMIAIEEGKKIKSKIKEILPIVLFIPLLIAIIFYYIIDRNTEMYSISIDLFCAVLAFSMGAIVILKRSSAIEEVYIKIGIGFAIVSILKFINVIINFNDIEFAKKYQDITQIVIFITNNILFILAFSFKIKRLKTKFLYIIYSVLVILSIISIVVIMSALNSNVILKDIISFSLMFFLGITCLIILYKTRIIQKDEKIMFYIYLIFTAVYEGIYIYGYFVNHKLYFSEYLFKYLSLCVIYKAVEKNFFFKAYEREKILLEESQIKQKKLNEILKTKNKELTEFKSIIEKSEKRQRKLMDDIKDAIVIMSFDRISYINKAALEGMQINKDYDNIIGMSSEEIYKSIISKKLLNTKNIKEIKNILTQEFEGKKLYKLIKIKKSEQEYEIYYVRLNTVDRLFYVKDVTYLNENENLRCSYEKCLKEENLKDEFYSNISHELRTPINLVFSALQVNDIYLIDKNLQGINKNNITIKQNCLRLIRTINNFIDANKISEGYLVPIKKVHNIVAIVENISLACREYIDRIENNLIFDSIEEEIYAEVDKDMIERVMLNILSNSVKYGEHGATVFIDVNKVDDKVVIAVKNDLYTISEETMPYIFDKFTKLNKALNREREGSGLGLFLSRALLELQNGTIDVKSNKEIGTEFIITLPIYSGKVNIENEEEMEISNDVDKVDTEFSDIYF